MIEKWKDIPGYDNYYQVSSIGRVRRLVTKTGKPKIILLKLRKEWTGYLSGSLSVNHEEKIHKVHRLVALAFIKNPFKKEYVNHIDGVRSNNNVTNLEWVTKSENEIHAYRVLGKKPAAKGRINNESSKSVVVIDQAGNKSEYASGKEAARRLNVNYRSLNNNLRGRSLSAGGFTFKYK